MFWSRFRQVIFAVSAVIGAVWPISFVIKFILATKDEISSSSIPFFDVTTFSNQVWVNFGSSFVASDLIIVLILAIAFMITESKRLKLKFWGIYIVLTFLISFAFSFSLFMFVRERKLAESIEVAEAST
ncbi:MAG: DUF2834 domain-containing protein [Cyanobacteria bacterium J06621_8]